MAFFHQLHTLRRQVQDQLRASNDPETGSLSSGSVVDKKDSYSSLSGIQRKEREDGSHYYLVSWVGPEDPQNPHNWSKLRRLKTNILLMLISFAATAASSIDSVVVTEAADQFGVSIVTETLGGTGMFLIGFGIGALVTSPLSEFVGRFPAYLGTLVLFAIWLMASALSPNIGAQIVFRLLAGVFASTPLTVAGGSLSDIWNAKERTWAFPMFAIGGFGGPTLGPVMGAYIGYTGVLNWQWVDWISLIVVGLVTFLVIGLMEETFTPRILKYKAHYFRKLSGSDLFLTELEASGETTVHILERNFLRPFVLATEPIVFLFVIYLTIVYIVMFTFLVGYTNIFQQVYGINSGLTGTIFVALFLGVLSQVFVVPFVYRSTVKQLARDGDDGQGHSLVRESRLIFAMLGAPVVVIGLFWMGWTDFKSISIWSPIIASAFVGFGIMGIFISAYMYIIDSYEAFAASALAFNTLVRYITAGGMTVVGVPMYNNLGPRYTLTVLACISLVVVPIPYALYKWGPQIRARSKYAVN